MHRVRANKVATEVHVVVWAVDLVLAALLRVVAVVVSLVVARTNKLKKNIKRKPHRNAMRLSLLWIENLYLTSTVLIICSRSSRSNGLAR